MLSCVLAATLLVACGGSAPTDPRVQREALATGTAGETASVHLVVEVWPTR